MMRSSIWSVALLLAVILLAASTSTAATARLLWDPPAANGDGGTLTDLAGYYLYFGTSAGRYTKVTDVAKATTVEVQGLIEERDYYYAVSAYDVFRNEGPKSNEFVLRIGGPPATPTPDRTSTPTKIPTKAATPTKIALPTATATRIAPTPTRTIVSTATRRATYTPSRATATPARTPPPLITRMITPLPLIERSRGDFNGDGISDIGEITAGVSTRALVTIDLSGTGMTAEMEVEMSANARQANGDYDGNGSWDLGFVRPSAAGALLWTAVDVESNREVIRQTFGGKGSKPIPGCDMDRDERTDLLSLERNKVSMKESATRRMTSVRFSAQNVELPFCADVNGDGADEIVAFVRVKRLGPRQSSRSIHRDLVAYNKERKLLFKLEDTSARAAFAADIDGNGAEEIAVIENRKEQTYVRFVNGGSRPQFAVSDFSDFTVGTFEDEGGQRFLAIVLKQHDGRLIRLDLLSGKRDPLRMLRSHSSRLLTDGLRD